MTYKLADIKALTEAYAKAERWLADLEDMSVTGGERMSARAGRDRLANDIAKATSAWLKQQGI